MDAFSGIGLVIVLVLLNGFFVASEFALVAVRKTKIEELVRKGNAAAKLAKKAIENLDTYISATQLGITLASLALGWVGEPALARLFEGFFSLFLPSKEALITSHGAAFIFAFSLITFLHIVIGELAPKSIALQKSETTTLWVIAPLTIFAEIFKPFIRALNGTGLLAIKLLGFKGVHEKQAIYSEDEIKMILTQSAESGAIEKEEAEMVFSVLKLGDLPVKQIMIPRTKIIGFDINTTLEKVISSTQKNPHSRFPVYKDSIDNIVGFIHIKEVYKHALCEISIKSWKKTNILRDHLRGVEGVSLSQTGLIRTSLFVPDTRRIDDVLLDMQKKRLHMAIVNDEYGGVSGIVTLEDVIESLVGEIQDEFEVPYTEIQKQADDTYMVDGLTSVENIKGRFNLSIAGEGYSTIGGLVLGLLGHDPTVGEKLNIGNLEMEIKELESKRIKSLLIRKNIPAASSK